MNPTNPYESPQAEVPTPSETWPKKLAAIVGVGATISFWTTALNAVFYSITTLITYFDPAYASNGLYQLLEGLTFWVIPIPQLLGYFLLFQVSEASGAKSCFKWSMVLLAVSWSWQIALFYEKNPEDVPVFVSGLFNLLGTASGLILYVGCLRLSLFCEDPQMVRWSKLALFFGICFSLMLTIHDIISLFTPHLLGGVAVVEAFWNPRLYELFVYAQWGVWFPLIYLHCRTLWRIPAHAEIEALPNTVTTSPQALPRTTDEPESEGSAANN